MTGDGPRRSVGKGRALPGGGPTGAASRRLAAVPASRGPVVARRYAPTGTGLARNAAVDGARPCSPRAAVDCHTRSAGVSGGHLSGRTADCQDSMQHNEADMGTFGTG